MTPSPSPAPSAPESAVLEAVALGIPSALSDLGTLVRIPGIAWPAFDQTQLERSADAVADLARGTGVFDEVRRAIRLTPGARTLVRTLRTLGHSVALVSGGFIEIVAPLADDLVAARAPWSYVLRAGETLTMVDLDGNQAVDTLFYDAHDPASRYSGPATLAAQRSLFLTTGSVLRDADSEPLVTIVADEVGNHDTVGGACSQESNTLRYGHHTKHQHACVENFLREGARHGLGKRDLVPNVNFFMNVPVEADGTLGIVDGLSGPGKRLALRADRDVLVLVSNCPQINNPCNGFDPSPVRMIVTA